MSRQQPDFFRQPARLQAYLDGLTQAAGHADRVVPIENYTKGLMLPIERKSVEPMAARLAPGNVRQMHQSLHHIVADAPWSDDALLKQVRSQVLPAMTRKHAIAAWIVDDTGFPKKGSHSVGVTRQYCGQLGKQDNCRVAVSVSLATEEASIPAAYRLYLPEIWANDPERRKQAGVPKEIRFQTKPEIALGQIRSLVARMCRVAWCWPMPPMATITDSARDWNRWNFPTRLASSLRPRYGHRRSRLFLPNPRAKWAVRHGCCAGISNISRFRPKNLPCA
jgi:SRSO17 transposase